jgi:hypothetical protein
MLAHLNWTTLQERRGNAKAVMYRVVNKLIDIPSSPILVPTNSLRGNNISFIVPYARTLIHQKSFFPDGICIWNALPSEAVFARIVVNSAPSEFGTFIQIAVYCHFYGIKHVLVAPAELLGAVLTCTFFEHLWTALNSRYRILPSDVKQNTTIRRLFLTALQIDCFNMHLYSRLCTSCAGTSIHQERWFTKWKKKKPSFLTTPTVVPRRYHFRIWILSAHKTRPEEDLPAKRQSHYAATIFETCSGHLSMC